MKNFKRNLWLYLALIIAFSSIVYLIYLDRIESDISNKKIAIISIVEIEPIKQLRDGFKKIIKESDFAKNNIIQFSEYNAQGEKSLINQLVDQIVTERPDLVYVLGTPISQAIQKRDKDIIIVQGAVTDPIEAGLADSWEKSNRNFTGNSDLPPIDIQLKVIQTLIPNIKKLGIAYNPGEINSVAIIKRIKEYIETNSIQIELIERPVSNTSEIASVTESFIGNVDALYIPPDNTIHAGIKVVGKIASENKIPLFTTTSETIEFGALSALSLDFNKLGEEAGFIALQILTGKQKAKNIPIQFSREPQILINKSNAESFNIDLDSIQNLPNVILK